MVEVLIVNGPDTIGWSILTSAMRADRAFASSESGAAFFLNNAAASSTTVLYCALEAGRSRMIQYTAMGAGEFSVNLTLESSTSSMSLM